jgi:hypothetical protein
MNFVTFAALFATASAQATDGSGNSANGALNYIWTNDFQCPDFTNTDNQVEFAQYGTDEEGLSFENFKQSCAEQAYGWDAETAPCVSVMYLPGGFNYAADGTGAGDPFYGCGAFLGDTLVEAEKDNSDMIFLENLGLNLDDENNRVASCINTSPENVPGAYSCSRGPLLIGAEYLTLGAVAALSIAATL